MKIAFTGTHQVGKTTLAEKFHATLPHYIFVPEPFVELEEKGHSFSHPPKPEDFSIQLNHAIEQLDLDEPDVLYDRCPLDLLAYLFATGDTKSAQNYYTKVLEAMDEIDLLVFVPIDNPDVVDFPEFPELREKVNDLLEDWLADFDIESVTVNGTLAERERQVIEAIIQLD